MGTDQRDHSVVLSEHLNPSSVPTESCAEPGTREAKLRPTRLSNDPIKSGLPSQTGSHWHMKRSGAFATPCSSESRGPSVEERVGGEDRTRGDKSRAL